MDLTASQKRTLLIVGTLCAMVCLATALVVIANLPRPDSPPPVAPPAVSTVPPTAPIATEPEPPAPTHGFEITSSYDRFEDLTLIETSWWHMPVRDGDRSASIRVQFFATHYGQQPRGEPFVWMMATMLDSYSFGAARGLIIDGQRFEIEDRPHEDYGATLEIPGPALRMLPTARVVEFKLGHWIGRLDARHLDALRDVARRALP